MTGEKKNKRTIIWVIVVLVVVGVFLYSTQVANSFKMDDAVAMAEEFVPKGAVLVEQEKDHDEFDLKFVNENYDRTYEITVNKARKGISDIEIYSSGATGSDQVILIEEDIKDILNRNFNHLTEVNVNLASDDGLYVYEVSFKSKRFYGEAEINPQTGFIGEIELSYLRKAVPTDSDFYFDTNHPKSQPMQPVDGQNKDKNNNNAVAKKENRVSAKNSCDIVPRGNCQSTITEDQARQAVKDKLPGIKITEIELEKQTFGFVYEGEGVKGDYEYDFEVNGKSGQITKWEKELIN